MRPRRGFTLIELLIVCVIIAVLAGIASARYWRSRDRAYVASMISDLRTLNLAQENFRSDSAYYTTDIAKLVMVRGSAGVVMEVDRADATTWHAAASHPNSPSRCEITSGVAAGGAGVPTCITP